MSKNLGEKIKKIRDSQNLSQERFGKKIGLSGKSISAYETGRTTPPLRVLEKISEAYNANILNVNKNTREELKNKLELLQQQLKYIGEIVLND